MSLTAWAQEEKAKREAWDEIDRLKKRIAELEKQLKDADDCLTIAYMQGSSESRKRRESRKQAKGAK